jgi:hypothetical protein
MNSERLALLFSGSSDTPRRVPTNSPGKRKRETREAMLDQRRSPQVGLNNMRIIKMDDF